VHQTPCVDVFPVSFASFLLGYVVSLVPVRGVLTNKPPPPPPILNVHRVKFEGFSTMASALASMEDVHQQPETVSEDWVCEIDHPSDDQWCGVATQCGVATNGSGGAPTPSTRVPHCPKGTSGTTASVGSEERVGVGSQPNATTDPSEGRENLEGIMTPTQAAEQSDGCAQIKRHANRVHKRRPLAPRQITGSLSALASTELGGPGSNVVNVQPAHKAGCASAMWSEADDEILAKTVAANEVS
jgi:hypothetical protein